MSTFLKVPSLDWLKATAEAMLCDADERLSEQRNVETQEWERTAQIVDIGDLTPFTAFRTIDPQGRTLAIPSLAIGATIPLEQLEEATLFLSGLGP